MQIDEEARKKLRENGFTILEKINYGSFSEVHKALFNHQEIAVKVINLRKLTEDMQNNCLKRELPIIKQIKHRNIIHVYEIFQTTSMVFIFMEKASSDVLQELTTKGPASEEQSKIWFKQLLAGVRCIHAYGVAHRDLKIDNLLLDENNTIKITDFGFSRNVFDEDDGRRVLSTTCCGSDMYSAPEIIIQSPYNPQMADIWSMGVILYTMLNDHFPFDDALSGRALYWKQMNRDWSHVDEEKLSHNCKDIVKQLMEPEVNKRFTLKQIREHPWLNEEMDTSSVESSDTSIQIHTI